MVGGDADLVQRADTVLHAMGKSIFHTGPLGAGHAMKTINNYIAALNLVSALQGLLVGKKYGLDPEQMVDIINASYGRNAATEFVVKQQVTSGKFAANFKMWLMAKDANVMAETARHVGYSAPLPQDLTVWLRGCGEDARPRCRFHQHVQIFRHLLGGREGGGVSVRAITVP